MKQERSGISLLLGLLLVFSSLVGALHAQDASAPQKQSDILSTLPLMPPAPTFTVQKRTPEQEAQDQLESLLDLVPVGQALHTLLPSIQSESMESIIEHMKNISVEQAEKILSNMVNNSLLLPDDLLFIITGFAHNYPKPEDKNRIFSLMLNKELLQKGSPVLYVAADGKFAPVIPALQMWINTIKKERHPLASLLGSKNEQALLYAIKKHNAQALANMHNNGLAITPVKASELLWHAARDKDNLKIVDFLIKQGADVNYAHKGATPLIQAVRAKNVPLVEALVKTGVDVNKIVRPDVGSALQIIVAMQHGFQEGKKKKSGKDIKAMLKIEQLLRDHGARE